MLLYMICLLLMLMDMPNINIQKKVNLMKKVIYLEIKLLLKLLKCFVLKEKIIFMIKMKI